MNLRENMDIMFLVETWQRDKEFLGSPKLGCLE